MHRQARDDIVWPAIVFHDVGWKRVPRDQRLLAIGPGTKRPDLMRLHEQEGAAITVGGALYLAMPMARLVTGPTLVIDGGRRRA